MGETAVEVSTKEYEVAEKIPTPEEVFRIPKITWPKKILYIWGPSVIALGISIGSGEFLLGPAVAIKVGLSALWIVLLSVILQVSYIYSYVRLAIITGETPVTMFMRIGIWAGVLGALAYFLGFVWGGWAASTAAAVTGGILGRPTGPADKPLVAFLGIILLIIVFILLTIGERVARTLEIIQWFIVFSVLGLFIILAIAFVSPSVWAEAAKGLVSFGHIPSGMDLVLLGGWWGYTAYATGLNYIIAFWYKDKGYGMGSLTGYISGLVGGKRIPVALYGKIFRPSPENLSIFERWKRIAMEEILIIFTIGALIGMILPMTIAYTLARGMGIEVAWGLPLWLSMGLGKFWGGIGWWLGVYVAFAVLMSTQLGITDSIVRVLTDPLWKIESVRRIFRDDIRYLYYTILAVILAWVSLAFFIIPPGILILISANMANFGALFGVPFLLYINYKLIPKELRLHWSLVILNVIFMVACLIFLTAAVGRALGVW